MSPIEPTKEKAKSDSIALAVSQTLQTNSTAVLATLIEAPIDASSSIGLKLLVRESSSVGSLGNVELNRAVVERALTVLGSRADTKVETVGAFAPELTEWTEAK